MMTANSKHGLEHTPDILIIGGGPSGLSTALHLQRIAPHLTPRILILEKEQYPRFKLCAGGLTVDAESIIEQLDLNLNEVPHVLADDVHLDFEARGLNVRMPKRHALRIIRRDEFDNWLADKAKSRGIEIKEGVTVKNVVPQTDKVIVETDQGTIYAQIVVGADGSNGVTRRCIFPKEPVYTARVLEVLTHPHRPAGTSPIPQMRDGGGREGVAFFEFSPVPYNIAGYIWDFPTQVKGEPMRCWGIYDTNLLADGKRPQLKEPLANEMQRFGLDLDDYEIKGHPIRWFSPENEMSVPRVLLVGDAVGADPIFGEGISIALGYGKLAAQEISEAIQRDEVSFRRFKRRVVRSALGQALVARWLITYIIYPMKWRWFQILLWRVMKPVVLLVAWMFVLNWGRRLR
ncbi:MAG: NAD(P)/FAD-dependent oxidoreductase [Anaerolineales bacterium]|nr:NAD(P)/FAD-dependent oxidoreductase [Anaerolineales bacterium]